MKKKLGSYTSLVLCSSLFAAQAIFAADLDKALGALSIEGNLDNLYNDLSLPQKTSDGIEIAWESSEPLLIDAQGHISGRLVGENKAVTLTATLKEGSETRAKAFQVSVHGFEPYSNYLFVYFPANNNENIYYAISNDGYNYTPMNNGKMVVAADTVSLKKGLRDPHILRAPDGWFYMVNTDMKSAEGWSSNRGMVLMKSKDLIHWNHSTVHFPDKYKGTYFANVTRVWAPETIWDQNYANEDGSKGRLMVYFSILTNDNVVKHDKVFYAYANDDFTDLIGEPTYFYDRGSATIDMDIVYNPNDALYHAFYKNEGEGGICKVTAKELTAPKGKEGSQWSSPSSTLQQTTEAVEGAGVFKLINQDSWILMYDCYVNGHYQFTSSPDLTHFTKVQDTEMKGAFTPRHGTVIPITASETSALMKVFPTPDFEPKVYEIPATLGKTAEGETIVGACATDKIIPYVKIDDGEWRESTDLKVEMGATVTFGPHPWDGKNWQWIGPDDFSSTNREIKLQNVQWQNSGIYEVSFVNETGCKSSLKIKMVVNDPDHPYVEPVVEDTSSSDTTAADTLTADTSKVDSTNVADTTITSKDSNTFISRAFEAQSLVKPLVDKTVYLSVNGQVLAGKPHKQGVYIRLEYSSNKLVQTTKFAIK